MIHRPNCKSLDQVVQVAGRKRIVMKSLNNGQSKAKSEQMPPTYKFRTVHPQKIFDIKIWISGDNSWFSLISVYYRQSFNGKEGTFLVSSHFTRALLQKNISASFVYLLVSLLFIYYSVFSYDSNFTFFLLFIFVFLPLSSLVNFLSFIFIARLLYSLQPVLLLSLLINTIIRCNIMFPFEELLWTNRCIRQRTYDRCVLCVPQRFWCGQIYPNAQPRNFWEIKRIASITVIMPLTILSSVPSLFEAKECIWESSTAINNNTWHLLHS